MTIFRYALKRSVSDKTNIVVLLLLPIACIFMPKGEYWPLVPYGYQYFGILVLFVGIRLATLIMEDRKRGLVKRLAVAPVAYFQYLGQNVLAFVVLLVAQSAIVVGGGMLVGLELYKPGWLLLLYVSFSFASLAVAMAWISFYRSKETSFLVYMSLIFLIVVMGGLLLPISMFPAWLERIAVIFPTYWLAEGLTWIAVGEQVGEIGLILGVLWLFTLLFLVLGSVRKMS